MARFCPNCGAALDDAARFCGGCGTQFTTQQAQPQQPQQQPPPYQQQPYRQQPYMQPQYQQPYMQPQVQQPYAPPPPPPPPVKKKSKAPLAIVVLVLVALIGVGIFTKGFGLFGGIGKSNGKANENFAPDKTAYEANDVMRVTVKGITQEMVDNGAFIGIYAAGAKNADYWGYDYVYEVGSSVMEIVAPGEDGSYELRLFSVDSSDEEVLKGALVYKASFAVGEAPTQAGKPKTTKGGNNPAPAGSGGESPLIPANNFTGDYSITYKMTASEGGTSLQTYMHNSQGYYTSFGDAGSGSTMRTLYLKNGDTYDAYLDWGDGSGFNSYGTSMPEEEIEQGFIFLSTKSMVGDLYGGILKKDGSETVAGKSCDKFSATITAEGVTGKVSYSFDKQTGVLMKWTTESPGGSMVYECTEFKTSGVTLPSKD